MNLGKDPRRRKERVNLLLLRTVRMKINKEIWKATKAIRVVFIILNNFERKQNTCKINNMIIKEQIHMESGHEK